MSAIIQSPATLTAVIRIRGFAITDVNAVFVRMNLWKKNQLAGVIVCDGNEGDGK